MAVGTKLMSAEELERLPDRKRSELVKGELVPMTPVNREHGATAVRLASRLHVYVEQHQLGEVGVETGYILSRDPDTVRAPDVSFISASRLSMARPTGFVAGPPDLAVEVVSPEDSADAVVEKVQEYLRAGTRLVVVAHPRTRTVTVYRPDGSARVLQTTDHLDGGDVVPDFSMPVSDIFGA